MRKLHAHVPQAAQSHDAHFLALGHTPVMQRGVGRDSRAKQRRHAGQVQIGGNVQDEMIVDDDAVGVAAEGHAAQMLLRRVVGVNAVRAELFQALFAVLTGAVGINHAANRGEVAGLEVLDGGTDLGDAADDLVSRRAGVNRGHEAGPLVANRMKIGMADAAEEDFDLYVVLGRIAAVDGGGS